MFLLMNFPKTAIFSVTSRLNSYHVNLKNMDSSLYSLTLLFHSTIRYFVLIAILVSIFRSARGWFGGAPFGKLDEKMKVWLLIMAHTQLLLGLTLYALSPLVQFSAETMSTTEYRYWTVEHITMMIVAITLITLSHITTKRLTEAPAKHKRVFLYNIVSLLIIIAAIAQSKRGFFSLPDVM